MTLAGRAARGHAPSSRRTGSAARWTAERHGLRLAHGPASLQSSKTSPGSETAAARTSHRSSGSPSQRVSVRFCTSAEKRARAQVGPEGEPCHRDRRAQSGRPRSSAVSGAFKRNEEHAGRGGPGRSGSGPRSASAAVTRAGRGERAGRPGRSARATWIEGVRRGPRSWSCAIARTRRVRPRGSPAPMGSGRRPALLCRRR